MKNLIRSSTGISASAPPVNDVPTPINIYHLHPLVAGPLEQWPREFERIAAMGFSHVCVAPPFEPGLGGDIFVLATVDRLHPALQFDGTAEQGLAFAAKRAANVGLRLMLDIVPGNIAIDSPLRQSQPEWFTKAGPNEVADPRRPPRRRDVAVPQLGQTSVADAICDWWIGVLERFIGAGIAGFRCLTLDVTQPAFWRRIISRFPNALFLAWTPGVPNLREFVGVGFNLTCSSAGWWDGKASWLLDEQVLLQSIAPAVATPEPSFFDRLAQRLEPGTNVANAYRLALRIAAATSAGLFLPMGFEFASSRRFDSALANPADMRAAERDRPADLTTEIRSAVDLVAKLPPLQRLRSITSPASPVTALLRSTTMILINPDIVNSVPIPFGVDPLPQTAGRPLTAESKVEEILAPGEVRIVPCRVTRGVIGTQGELARIWAETTRIVVESVEPSADFPVKAVVGREFNISSDIFSDGHDVLAADLLWRPADSNVWQRYSMEPLPNDRWRATVRPDRIGLHWFAIEGWWDQWGTFTHDLRAKLAANQDVKLEIQEGIQLVEAAGVAQRGDLTADWLLSASLAAEMKRADSHPFAARSSTYSVRVDRPAAEFASWYELFPRSATGDPALHGTFRSVIDRLPDIRAMGFNVLYFPPIHPIGRINRKGRNNSLHAEEGDVGSPYAIGSAEGGHDTTHPELGTLDDFRELLNTASENDLEIAIDFAIQCAPDHPWVSQHKEWFRWRLDGSMRYAENPPKKYEDIVNPDFYNEASFPSLWIALRDVIQFWVDQGVRIFRVDNPHTKPLPFWQWMIADIQGRHPDVLFLSEAFTRPKLMYRLAKVGFSQSYTYFTWRNTKQEIIEYLTEITTPPVSSFFRPNFFVNTPDINPIYLQTAGRPGFLIRAVLAATLSGLWGVYSGFEICEATPLPGREEYLNSEKYEIRPRNYAAPGNIVAEITALNRIRRQHPALQSHLGVTFYPAYNDQVILYGKRDPIDHSMVLVAVSFDPHVAQGATIEVPLWEFGLDDSAAIYVTDLMREENFVWNGKIQQIRLDPSDMPFRIWRLQVR